MKPDLAENVDLIESERRLLTSRLDQLNSSKLVFGDTAGSREAEIEEILIEERSVQE